MKTFKTMLKTELKLSLRGMDMFIFAICMPVVVIVLLGIIYGDKPAFADAEYTFLQQSFGAVSGKDIHCDLPIRNIDSGHYAIFEVPHAENDVANFWKNIDTLTSDLPVDYTKPIIERYAFSKISLHLCEFCIPLK